MSARRDNGTVIAVVRAVLQEPFSRRARLELLWCVVGFLTGAAGLAVVAVALFPGTAVSVARGVPILILLLVGLVATGAARTIAGWYRQLAARLLGVQVDPSPPVRAGRGLLGLAGAQLRDAGSWRALAYILVKVPFAALQEYALLYWFGLVNMTYPFWWGLFRNHEPGVELRPVLAITPFGFFRVATHPGAFVVLAAGAGMVLAAPWVTRAVTAVDRWLLVTLLGPGRLTQRVRHLEESRALVVDDAASTLRRIERDLHDGAQAQLATLAMKLGQAKEKLEHDSAVAFDPAGAHELVDAAHHHAKEALVELRNIARGVHPPALDVGLDAALATLVARSPVPATLQVATEMRPAGAIETIAYFSVAELLANVARHSRAHHATVDVTGRNGRLQLAVTDDGVGGAEIGAGTGLTGLADRVRAVDGHLDVSSPQGGPTVIVVELPLHA
jgi:signal transduction histidine kinase